MHSRAAGRLLAGLVVAAALAGPARATTITVNSETDVTGDDGLCTLREAIAAANDNVASGATAGECPAGSPLSPGSADDTIAFSIPGTGPFTLKPNTPLPAVTEAVFIDGYSQPGAKANTLRGGSNAQLKLELLGDGTAPDCDIAGDSPIPGGAFKFVGMRASGSRVRGFAITGFDGDHPAAVVIFRAGGVQIDGNFIGFDTQNREHENFGYGIVVLNGVFETVKGTAEDLVFEEFDDGGVGNLIGGPSPQERNVIGRGRSAVFLGGQGNRVEGNYLGVDPQGLRSFPPREHTLVAGMLGVRSCQDPDRFVRYIGRDNTIGGLRETNLFSAESNNCAVMLAASGNRVEANFMGTDRDGGSGVGGAGLGAQPGCGVLLEGGLANHNTVTHNRIAFNAKGVVVRKKASGAGTPLGNDIKANAIHSNVDLGIDLGNDGVTANDAADGDAGPNGLQNFPERLAATLTGVRGELRGAPNVVQRIDFYQNDRCDSSGFGQGAKHLGQTSVLTDSNGKASFSVSVPGLVVERAVSATTTTAVDGTSEFSKCATVLPGSSLMVEVQSSRNPARSHETFQLTILAKGFGGNMPKGVVLLQDLAHPTLVNGLPDFPILASAQLAPSSAGNDTAEALVDSTNLQLRGSLWGNVRIRALYLGDAVYARSSGDFTQTIYREKSDLDGDGLSDLLLCDAAGGKSLVQDAGGSFTGPFPLPALDNRTVLGTAEFGLPQQPSVVWSDATGALGGTTFAGAASQFDFDVPLPSGLTFEALGSMYGGLKDDFVVRDATGQHFGLLTGDLNLISRRLKLLSPTPTGPPNNFRVEQVGDFNGDGNLDWHLRHPTSMAHVLWLIDIFRQVVGSGVLAYVPAGGVVVATGDFNGDGATDHVWALPNGDYEIALQNGTATAGRLTLNLAASAQAVVGTAFLDDGTGSSGGRSSLVVRSTTPSGQVEAWINTGVSAGLPVFGIRRPVPTGGRTDLTMCVP